MSCAGRHHMAKRSEATRDYTDTNWDGNLTGDETVAVVEADLGNGVLRVADIIATAVLTSKTSDRVISEPVRENNDGESSSPSTTVQQVQVPGKFHKLIWFLRNDIVVHDGHGTLVRKVSDEQLKRLAKEQPDSVWVPAWELQAARHDKRPEDEKAKEILDRRPNWAARVVHTGFTSSDDDDDDENDEEQGQEEDEEGDHEQQQQ